MSLGATGLRILSMVVKHLTWPIIIGSTAGVLIAASLTQLLRGELYGVSALDPLAYVAATILFSGMVTAAALLPARRALRVDVVTSLRHD